MQDRFKFRVYYKPHNKVYNVICLNCDRQKEIIIEYNGSTALVEWENCEIMQSTGLHDKNGKLIYEGDIVQFPNPYEENKIFRQIVEWQELALTIGYSFTPFTALTVEVIGNIYENPELLEAK